MRLKNKVWMTCTSKKHSLSRLKQTTWSVKCKVFCWRFRCEQEPHKFQRIMYVKSNETIAFNAREKKNKCTQERKKNDECGIKSGPPWWKGTLTIEPSILYRELLEIYS